MQNFQPSCDQLMRDVVFRVIFYVCMGILFITGVCVAAVPVVSNGISYYNPGPGIALIFCTICLTTSFMFIVLRNSMSCCCYTNSKTMSYSGQPTKQINMVH